MSNYLDPKAALAAPLLGSLATVGAALLGFVLFRSRKRAAERRREIYSEYDSDEDDSEIVHGHRNGRKWKSRNEERLNMMLS